MTGKDIVLVQKGIVALFLQQIEEGLPADLTNIHRQFVLRSDMGRNVKKGYQQQARR
jgi:hypothetical protein